MISYHDDPNGNGGNNDDDDDNYLDINMDDINREIEDHYAYQDEDDEYEQEHIHEDNNYGDYNDDNGDGNSYGRRIIVKSENDNEDDLNLGWMESQYAANLTQDGNNNEITMEMSTYNFDSNE